MRPENVGVRSGSGAGIAATIASVSFLGEFLDCRLQVGDQFLHVRQHPTLVLAVGQRVTVDLSPEHCVVMRAAPDRGPGPA